DESECKRHTHTSHFQMSIPPAEVCPYRRIVEEFRTGLSITMTRVTLPVSRSKTSSHLPEPVISLLRASSGYWGRGMLNIYGRIDGTTVASGSADSAEEAIASSRANTICVC